MLQGFNLICSSWKTPPAMIVLENVPRIRSRGAPLLAQVRQLLHGYGYLFNEETHDSGEIGGLAQHRRRFLLVARLPSKVNAYVYRPPIRRVLPCGDVLGRLPVPHTETAGRLHLLPKLSGLNWVRLALIPAGGDWRDLPKGVALPAENPGRHEAKYRVERVMPIRFPPIPAEPLAADKVALCDRLQVASCAWYLSPGSSSLGVFRSSSGGSP